MKTAQECNVLNLEIHAPVSAPCTFTQINEFQNDIQEKSEQIMKMMLNDRKSIKKTS